MACETFGLRTRFSWVVLVICRLSLFPSHGSLSLQSPPNDAQEVSWNDCARPSYLSRCRFPNCQFPSSFNLRRVIFKCSVEGHLPACSGCWSECSQVALASVVLIWRQVHAMMAAGRDQPQILQEGVSTLVTTSDGWTLLFKCVPPVCLAIVSPTMTNITPGRSFWSLTRF